MASHLVSPMTGHRATRSSSFSPSASGAVADEAASTRHRAGAGGDDGKPLAEADAGAAFVLESKGTWWHAGFHLTTAMVGPAVLSLPYAFRGIGWGLGLGVVTALGAISFYTYYIMSRVLDHCEAAGRRHIRFHDLAADIFGSGWAFYLVVAVQTAINTGTTIGSILLAANCVEILYSSLTTDGPLKLYHFILLIAVVLALLSQMPSFHSLRYINLGSLLLSLGYTILLAAACIRAGLSSNAPTKDYSLSASKTEKIFDAFLSVSILAAAYGNGILPEIQATLAPPAAGKMAKALVICYSVASFTFYLPAITGYWASGKTVRSNAMQSLMPETGPSLAGADVASRPRRRARPPPAPGHRAVVRAGGVRGHGEDAGGPNAREVLAAEPGAAGGAADHVCGVLCLRGGGAAVLWRNCGRDRICGVYPARLCDSRRHVQHGGVAA